MEHLAQYPTGSHAYNRGCRCVPCKRANTERCHKYQATPRGLAYKRTWRLGRIYLDRLGQS